MTKPLPTLAEIDAELIRCRKAQDAARREIVSLADDIADLDAMVDEMLEHRSRIAALPRG